MNIPLRTTGARELIEAIALAARFNSDARELHAQRRAARSADVPGSTR
jgi:hypothetical protein